MSASNTVKITFGFAVSALLMAAAGLMPLVNAVVFCGFAAAAYFYFSCSHRSLVHNSLWVVMLISGVLIATYRPTGFNYPLIINEPFLSPGGQSFELNINLSKALTGWMLVVLFWGKLKEASSMHAGKAALVVIGCILFVLGVAWWLLNLEWIPKFPGATIYFILVNVLVTCVAEEAFFRLLLQKHLMKGLANTKMHLIVPVVLTGLVFALVHHTDVSSALFAVYLVAGMGYAGAYVLTGRFSLAVATHAGVNIGHFLLLPYPLPA